MLVLPELMLMPVLSELMLMPVRAAELNAVNRRTDVRQGQLDNSGYLPGECFKQQCSAITTVLRRVLTWGMLQETIGSMRSTIPVIRHTWRRTCLSQRRIGQPSMRILDRRSRCMYLFIQAQSEWTVSFA